MQIETLRLFCDLVEAGSFSTAAEKHHVTQSAVSQRIAALEKEVDAKLLVRGRNTEATPEGRLFLQMAHEILEVYDRFRRELRESFQPVVGSLRIATVYSIGLHELPPYLKWFRDHYPDAQVQVNYFRSDEVYREVREERADLGLVAFPEDRPGLTSEVFWRDELVLICTPQHPFARRSAVPVPDLQNARFISFEPDLPTRKAVDALLRDAGVEVNPVMELDNVELVKRAVEVEDAVAILPQRTVYAEVEGGRLAQSHLEAPSEFLNRPLGMICRKNGSSSPAFREFTELLRTKRLF